MSKISVAILSTAMAFSMAPLASAGPRHERQEQRHEARQQLRHDRHERHEARDKLRSDIGSGNKDAIASDKAALEAANTKVQADKEALRQLRR